MKWLDKLERKFGRHAIPNLMRYIVIGNVAAYILYLINPLYFSYLYLDPSLVMKGQVWRLITFVFIPSNPSNPLFLAISLYFYYFIGQTLESHWGSFRFNVYYFTGILCAIIASFLFRRYGTPDYLNETLFLAFATLFPEITVMVFFIIPVKVKWLGWISAAMLAIQFIAGPTWPTRFYILFSLVNYFLFFGPQLYGIIRSKIRRDNYYKKANMYQNRGPSFTQRGGASGRNARPSSTDNVRNVAFHRCQVCGKTELDDPNMQFRYCSQCGRVSGGNYEYCMDHLNNHQHIQ